MTPVCSLLLLVLLVWLIAEIANAIIYVVFVAVVSFVAALLLKAVIPAAVHVWKCSSEYFRARIVAVEEYEAPPRSVSVAVGTLLVRPPRVDARVLVAPPAIPRSVRPPTLPCLTMVRPPTYVPSTPFPRALTSTPRSAFPRSYIVPRAFAPPAVLVPPVPLAPADEVDHMEVDPDMMDCDE